ncbi:MAG: PHP domain-containing protein [Clostridia bacterium]|nr:PHP domain-containing protein [Clostridia bacterium]
MKIKELESRLNSEVLADRLEAVSELSAMEKRGEIEAAPVSQDVNNHIHTWYSFSPYSPTKSVWLAHRAGLATAGIMDHDSISGAAEFRAAAEIVGLKSTSGAEIRVTLGGEAFASRRINNPDQSGVAYMTLHAVPECGRNALREYLAPVSVARGLRNRAMTERLNAVCEKVGICLDYDKDILPLSKAHEGGSVTERHILFALSHALTRKYGKGAKLISVLTDELGLAVSGKNATWLADEENPGYEYDVLGVLKGNLVSEFYINANGIECPDAKIAVDLGKKIGAIPAYAYLGDVGNSVTGDKKAQCFEDSYLDELFAELKRVGYGAVTYMPSRNTPEQLKKIREMCDANNLFQISGEDINSPRQSFVCVAARAPEFENLRVAAYTLIGSEDAASADASLSFSGEKAEKEFPCVSKRAEAFAAKCK